MKSEQKKKDNQTDTFWILWQSQKQFLLKICFIYTGNYHNAQDLLSEVMLKAYAKIDNQVFNGNPDRWLLTILKNAYIDNFRHKFKCKYKITYTDNTEAYQIKQNLKPSALTNDVSENEFYKIIESCLNNMPVRRGHICRLFFAGYTYDEICSSYEISQAAARQLICLSRNELRQQIELYYLDILGDKVSKSINSQKKVLHSHLLKYRQNGIVHYYNFVSSLSQVRLKQKEPTLKKYIRSHKQSNDRKLQLALNLSSQGRFNEALDILNVLIEKNYYCEDVFELQIQLLFLLNRMHEVLQSVDKAITNLFSVHPKFYVWWMISVDHFHFAERFLKANIKPNSPDTDLRLLLAEVYKLQGKHQHAYLECKKVNYYDNNNPQIYTYHLKNKITFEGYLQAREFTERQYKYDSKSAIHCFYYLHFLINEGSGLEDDSVILLFKKVYKKYFWHPDCALIKAFLYPDKKAKILKRRFNDYPECALSYHYLVQFTKIRIKVPKLNIQEKNHLFIIKKIYNN